MAKWNRSGLGWNIGNIIAKNLYLHLNLSHVTTILWLLTPLKGNAMSGDLDLSFPVSRADHPGLSQMCDTKSITSLQWCKQVPVSKKVFYTLYGNSFYYSPAVFMKFHNKTNDSRLSDTLHEKFYIPKSFCFRSSFFCLIFLSFLWILNSNSHIG